MRVVLISEVPAAVVGLSELLRATGHEPVALLCVRQDTERYPQLEELLRAAPLELDVVMPSTRARIAPLLRIFDADLALCVGFPWKIPPEALATPRYGIVNMHPSLLPRYRGPSPVSWAIRNGDTEIGLTIHYMDAELDTGNILGRAPIPLGDEHGWDDITPKLASAVGELLPGVLERVERGDPGETQEESAATYLGVFEPEYAWIDPAHTVAETERQVRAWRFQSESVEPRGALLESNGETVRVLRVGAEEPDGGRPIACADGTLWVMESEPA